MKSTLFIITILVTNILIAEETISKEQRLLEAKKYAQEHMEKTKKEVHELMLELSNERASAKTDEEKAAFNKKLQLLHQKQAQKLEDLHQKRQISFFKMLFHGIKQTKNENQTLPMDINSKKIYTRIDLNSVHYIGGLMLNSPNAHETILVYEKKHDKHGNRHILFLDGHVEISKLTK